MGKIVRTYEDLTEKQKRFIDNYVRSGNAARSAREAGYSGEGNSINVQANKLLNHPVISMEIARRKGADLAQVMVTTPEEAMRRMNDIFHGRVTQPVLTKDGEVVYVPPLFREQVQAGKCVMQALGMFDRKLKGPEKKGIGKSLDEHFEHFENLESNVKELGYDEAGDGQD
jgi:phage terminase small subunit